MSSFNQRECAGCGQPCDGFYCYLCTCQQRGVNLINGNCLHCTYGDGKPVTCCGCEGPLNDGFCSFCASRAGNSSAYDPNLNFFNNAQNFSDYPPQPQYQTNSCELCGNDAHYGYDCPPQVQFISNPDPCFNQNFDNYNFPQTSPSFPQQFLSCENCGGPHETFQYQPMAQNFYDSNSSGFDQFQPLQYPVIHQPPQETSVEMLQARMKSIQTFLKKFNRISFRETPKVLLLAWEKFFEIKHAFIDKQYQPENIQELMRKLLEDVQNVSDELSDYINTPNWNRPAFYDDDDDDEYTIQYSEYIKNLSNTPDLPTEEPDNSLSMRDEHLNTIPETESDEVIKSSVEDLVPIPSESEGLSDDMYDVPFCDNNHFDAESDLIESLLSQDTLIVYSLKIDSLLEEFAGELAHINSIPSGIHEADFDPEEDIRLSEQFLYDDTSCDDAPFEDIDYVEASPPDSELVSLEESPSSSPIPIEDSDSFLKETDMSLSYTDNSLPEFENFSDHTEETRSGSTTSHADISLPEYDCFYFEIEPELSS
ncbi:hypothetical protein Tco_1355815 [Tanacetum coccineum]